MAAPTNTSGLLQVDNDTTSETFNAGFTFTAGRDAIVTLVHFGSTQTVSAVSVSGTAATRDVHSDDGSNQCAIWRAQNITGGNANVVVTYSGGSDNYVSGSVDEWAAGVFVNPALDTGTANTANAASATPSVSTLATTSQDATVIYGVMVGPGQTNNGISGPSGWTVGWVEQNGNTHQSGSGAWKEETAAGVKTATWAMTSGVWRAGIVAYKLDGGGGGAGASHRNGIALSGISAINGITKSGISAINGLTI